MGLKKREPPVFGYAGLSQCICGAWSYNPCGFCGNDRGVGNTRPKEKK